VDDKTLQELRELTDALPHLEEMIQTSHCSVVEYEVDGTCIGIGLYTNESVAVQRAVMSAGTTFTAHQHDEHEILTVYQGSITVHTSGDRVLDEGDSIHISPGTAHHVTAQKDTWLIGVTVPASQGYPDA